MHLESSFLIFICQISNPQNKWDVWIVYLVVVSVLNFEVGFWRVDVALWSSQSQQKFGFAKDNVYFVYLYMMHMYDTHTHTHTLSTRLGLAATMYFEYSVGATFLQR